MSRIVIKQVTFQSLRPQGWWQLKNIQRSILRFISTVTQLNNQGPLHLKSRATHMLPGNLKEEWKCHNREESFRHDHSQVTVHFKSFDKVFTSSEIVINGVSICYSITLDPEKHRHCIRMSLFLYPALE